MIWDYLVESRDMNPLFVAWYSLTWVNVFLVVWFLTLVCWILFAVSFSFAKSNDRETPKITPPYSWFKIRWTVLMVLLYKKQSEINGYYIFLSLLLLVFSGCYWFVFKEVVKSPDYLVLGSFQNLSEKDLITAVNFLYRFASLGILLILLEVMACLTALIYFTSNVGRVTSQPQSPQPQSPQPQSPQPQSTEN